MFIFEAVFGGLITEINYNQRRRNVTFTIEQRPQIQRFDSFIFIQSKMTLERVPRFHAEMLNDNISLTRQFSGPSLGSSALEWRPNLQQ
jgi:hypothetical protein